MDFFVDSAQEFALLAHCRTTQFGDESSVEESGAVGRGGLELYIRVMRKRTRMTWTRIGKYGKVSLAL